MFETVRCVQFTVVLLFGYGNYVSGYYNITTYDSGSFVYITVPNLTNIDLMFDPNVGFVSLPKINDSQITEVPAQAQVHPESPIGYEIPCGIRGGNYTNVRIVGGTNAEPGEFPWQVSVQRSSHWSFLHLCGGAIISSYWIVTAAHCVVEYSPANLSVVAGDHNLFKVEGREQRVQVIRIVTRGYIRGNFTNDIALLQISPQIRLDSKWVAPICIPKAHYKFTGYGMVTGWGRLSENGDIPHILQRLSVPIVKKSKCRRWYVSSGYVNQLPGKCQLCSGTYKGGSDSCQGDSGGPFVCKRKDGYYYLCGIVSWGIGCARPKLPGIYT